MTPQTSAQEIDHSVALDLRRCQSQTKAESDHLSAGQATHAPALSITISRQAGANGPAIAQAVGDRLGWPVYDRELVTKIAEQTGLRRKLIDSVDEKKSSWLMRWLNAFKARPEITPNEYAHHLVHVLLSLAAHGECIIIGRGAGQILPKETTLRVRLIGPEAQRIKAIQNRFDLSAEEARRWIEKTDDQRIRFVKDHFHKDPGDPAQYDLVLNSSRLSIADCADLILTAVERLQTAATKRAPRMPEAVSSPSVDNRE
jgi:cytidylate kinase